MKSQLIASAERRLRLAGKTIIDFVMPPSCPVTGDAISEPHTLSGAGWRSIHFIEAPYCDRCGVPFSVNYGDNILCPSCISEPPAFDRARAAVVYDDASHKLIVSFKHSDRTENAAMFGAWLARAGGEIATKSALLTPVPLHPQRLLARRYNQSGLLACEAAKRLGAEFAPDLLVRKRATPPQKDLSASARQRNVSGAFAIGEKSRKVVRGGHVILIDDVLTTGATLSAAARALRRGGAARVDALVLARVVKGGVGAI